MLRLRVGLCGGEQARRSDTELSARVLERRQALVNSCELFCAGLFTRNNAKTIGRDLIADQVTFGEQGVDRDLRRLSVPFNILKRLPKRCYIVGKTRRPACASNLRSFRNAFRHVSRLRFVIVRPTCLARESARVRTKLSASSRDIRPPSMVP